MVSVATLEDQGHQDLLEKEDLKDSLVYLVVEGCPGDLELLTKPKVSQDSLVFQVYLELPVYQG